MSGLWVPRRVGAVLVAVWMCGGLAACGGGSVADGTSTDTGGDTSAGDGGGATGGGSGGVPGDTSGGTGGPDATTPGTASAPFPTIENLSLEWAFSGDGNANAIVSVRYRPLGGAWQTGMPLRRVVAGSNAGYSWATRHTGSLFDLRSATTYEIELTLTDPDGGSTTRTLQATTRAVPTPMAGAPIRPATPATLTAVLAAAQAGDIVELAAGSYSGFTIEKDGAADRPLVVRAATGLDPSAVVVNGEIAMYSRNHVQLRGLTVNGRIRFNGSRHVALVGNHVNAQASVGGGDGIVTYLPAENAYIADNTVVGTTAWAESAWGVNGNNLGEGILVTGPGHVIMNNRVRGFRDNISFLEGEQALTQYSIDVLNNDLSEAADDAIEADYCHHNCRIARNRITNAFVAMSSQPSLGGPTYFIRNVAYNIAYVAFKLYNGSNGDVILHNTVVKNGDGFGVFAGAAVRNLHARNNLFIGGAGGTWGGYSSGTGSPLSIVDLEVASASLDYNAYGSTNSAFNGRFGPSIRYANLTELRSRTSEAHAVAVDLSVFAAAVGFPSSPVTAYAAPDLRLAAAAAVDIGIAIPNVNDGHTGAAADAGAYERGAALPVVGPRLP